VHLTTDVARRLLGRVVPEGSRRLVPLLVAVLVVAGTAAGVVLATAGGHRAATAGPRPPVSSTRAAPAASAGAVVPLLGTSADANRAVPAISASPAASTRSATAPPEVAPLRGLRQADLLVVAPFTLSRHVQATVSELAGVTSADPIEAARITINGTQQAVLGVDPSTFRGYAAGPTAASDPLWQGVAGGGVAVSYTMGTLDRLALGRAVTVTGRQAERLRVVAFGTVGIGGVDAVVSDSVARSLGIPASNAIVISAPPASVTALTARIKAVLPRGAAVEPLVTPAAAAQAGAPSSEAAGAGLTTAQLTAALRAAESRQGLPYVWGAAGPAAFDCSGLVQWSFAQAGVAMPRVAADQARTGPAVPVSQLEPGDLLFYHTDPTAPGYISHVAIYLGNGWMIQAPQPGLRVQVVPANFGAQFAGAIRVSPRIAAAVAGGLA
jgi:peptidoglycan DL-endopeptidase CwlO